MNISHYFIIIWSLFLCLSCNQRNESSIVRTAEELLWSKPDSCLTYIEGNQKRANSHEKKILELFQLHAQLKTIHFLEDDTTACQLEEYFTAHKEYRYLGETQYLLGIIYSFQNQSALGTLYLKKADTSYQQAKNVPDELMGMLYIQLGYIALDERLYSLAREYYEKALPYFNRQKYPIYLAEIYMCLADKQENKDVDVATQYIDSALYYASKSGINTLYKEAEIRKYQYILKKDTNIISRHLEYLCDSCQYYSYAAELANYKMSKRDFTTATRYIQQLANDTSVNNWSKEQYYLLTAELYQETGHAEKAYHMLRQIYDWQAREIESSAYNRTYIISQKYDAAKEREMRLRETVKKQWAYFGIAIFLLICCLIAAYTLYIYKKGQYELLISQEQQKQLQQELQTNRAVLRTRIAERLEVAKQLHQWSSHQPEPVPDILNILSPKQAASDQENWKRFSHEFNLCYNNILQQLKNEHPDLTDSDLQYIAVTYLGFDITDISFLLGIGKRTIWNRRSIIKQHLALPEETNLDEWIMHEMELTTMR